MSVLMGLLKGLVARRTEPAPSVSGERGPSNLRQIQETPRPSDAQIARGFADCAWRLMEQNRHAEAVACVVEALHWNRRLFEAAVAALDCTPVAALLATCVAPSTPTETSKSRTKVSVIVCSRDDQRFAAVRATYEKALAGTPFDLHRIADARSLAEGYNRGLAASDGEIVIFSHDDISILSRDFRAELEAALDEFDMIGVAGATRLAGPTWIAGNPAERRQLVFYPPIDKATVPSCGLDGPGLARWHGGIQCLDGVFLAANRSALHDLRFDEERYDGFHLYDLDISYRAHLSGLKLGVCTRLGIEHASPGSYDDPTWQRYADAFCRQYELPKVFGSVGLGLMFSGQEARDVFVTAYAAWQENCDFGAAVPSWEQRLPRRTVLHIGCGDTFLADVAPQFDPDQWQEIRLDADGEASPDVIGTISDMSAIPTASVDAVFSSHTLEHLYWHEVPSALAETRRVLKPDGFLVAWVPDLQAAARWIAEDRLFEVIGQTPAGALTPFDMVFSHRGMVGRDKPFMAHHGGFTQSTLMSVMRDAGYGSVTVEHRVRGFDLQVFSMQPVVPQSLLLSLRMIYFQS